MNLPEPVKHNASFFAQVNLPRIRTHSSTICPYIYLVSVSPRRVSPAFLSSLSPSHSPSFHSSRRRIRPSVKPPLFSTTAASKGNCSCALRGEHAQSTCTPVRLSLLPPASGQRVCQVNEVSSIPHVSKDLQKRSQEPPKNLQKN